MSNYVFVFLTLFSAISCAQTPSQSPQEFEHDLNSHLKNQVLTIRHFYPGKKLEYNADGELPDGKPGDWLSDGIVRIAKVELRDGALQLEGDRISVKFEAEKPGPSYFASEKKVLISFPLAGTPSLQSLHRQLSHIFYTNSERVAEDLPPEIRELWNRRTEVFTSAGEKVYTLGPEIKPPKLVKRTRPSYPPGSFIVRIGKVVLSVVVNRDGRTSDVKVISGHPMLNQPAIEAIRSWRYQPATRNGIPVPVLMGVDVQFDLR